MQPITETEIFPVYEDYLQPARYKCAYGGRGSAKCLGRGTKVIMADASLRSVEDVRPGDQLMGPDGSIRNVLSIANGIGPLYKVMQKTGITYIVNDAHILAIERSKSCLSDYGTISKAGNKQRPNGRYAKYDTGKGYSLITAEEYSKKPERFKAQHYGFRRAIFGQFNENLPIDPYLLGLWLGDGSSKASEITTIDIEIVDYLKNTALQKGWDLSVRCLDKAPIYYLGQKYQRDGSFIQSLRNAKVWKNKHIPEVYFGASIEQRRELLAGLIDTDGHIANGTIEISQSKERMIDDIIRLAHGLGLKASKTKTAPICANNGKVCIAWKSHIGGDINHIPLLIKRKKEAASKLSKNKDWRRSRIDVEPIGVGEYFGFELDGDHLFMLSDGTVTHNTRTFVSILTNNVMQGWRVVCFREIMESIADSVYQEFVDEIERRDLGAYFNILKTHIECPATGGVIKFSGLKANSKRLDSQKLKGFSGFDCAWLEEANAVSADSWEALIPTMRKGGSEIWCSFNPASILEATYKLFVSERYFPDFDKDGKRYAIIKKINWHDNPRFPDELRKHMEQLKAVDYEAYLHIYEGEPISNDNLAVIKSGWVTAAVDAHIKLGIEPSGRTEGGFDVADDGPDCNALVWRRGIVALGATEWRDKDPVSAANHAHALCVEKAIEYLRYDDIGVGAGAKGQFSQMQAGLLESGARGFTRVQTEGWTASGAVDNPELDYLPGKKNADMFLNKKSQGWWLVADRFRHTYNAVNGKPHDPTKLISLSSGMAHLDKLKAELCQPNRDYLNGKVKVESKADMKKRGVPSPNLADAFVMAFAEGGGVDWSVWT